MSGAAQQPSLKRVMGPGLLLLFVVGDILGTGVYALTGEVAAEVGGAAWLPFLLAFTVAVLTACSYLELVTKYPRAAGAALYTHKAFGIHFVTFIVAFAVMCSGITSASTASRAFAANFGEALGLDLATGVGVTVVALLFIGLVGAINVRGVGESVKANVVLTCVELSGLLLIIMIGAWAIGGGEADMSRVTEFDTGGQGTFGAVTAATALAFFAMVGFEDSVNMAEETKNPSRIFPKVVLGGVAGFPTADLRFRHDVRRGELGTDQHAHGQPAGVRHESGRGAAPPLRPGACRATHPLACHHFHDAARGPADHLRR